MSRATTSKSKIKAHKAIEAKTDFFYYMFRNILLVSLPFIAVSALILSHLSLHSSATTFSSDHVYFTLSTSCTMSGELISPHTIEIHGGQYKTNVGTTKLNTYCNDGNGYSIYAIGSSNNIDGNTDLINSDNNNYNIATGIYDSSTATVNTPSSWSMKLSSGTGTGNTLTPPTIVNGYDDYSIVPNVYTQVAKRTSETEMNTNTDVTGSYLTTTYAIYTSSYQPAGSYSGNVKYVMIHPSSNMQTVSSLELAFFSAGKEKVQVDENHSYFAMQDMTSDVCNSVTSDGEITATQLVDIRDNKIYWVAKLADGHCWMTQNLDLDIGEVGVAALTSENTDLSTNENVYTNSNTIYALKGNGDTYGYTYEDGIATWIPERSTIPYGQLSKANWQNSFTKPYSYDGGETYPDINVTELNSGTHGLSGNYYNWTAAAASNNSNSVPGDVTNSICPKGWKLPAMDDFNRMLSIYNIISLNNTSLYLDGGFEKIISSPIYFIRAGGIINGGSFRLNISGYYWTPHVNNANSSNYYSFYESAPNSNPEYCSTGRDCGRSVRCIAR